VNRAPRPGAAVVGEQGGAVFVQIRRRLQLAPRGARTGLVNGDAPQRITFAYADGLSVRCLRALMRVANRRHIAGCTPQKDAIR
jgi:hypothetical protein